MAHQNIQDQDLTLVLTNDAKPRLKWTHGLHQRFVDAVAQLGGPEKATPKSLMRVMGIHGLTLYHLKSHLQKYRSGKSQSQSQHSLQEDFDDTLGSDLTIDYKDENPNQIDESLKIAQALQIQMEVQRKLHEQIEVQRHLQMRIEAQGRYLQSVLRKAQDTLSGYNFSAFGVEIAKTELSRLVSMVENGCPSSSLSVLTELETPHLKKDLENKTAVGSSLESSLTSSEDSGRKESEMNRDAKSGTSNFGSGRKRNGSMVSDCSNCVECCSTQDERSEKTRKRFDLNSQYVNDFDESKSSTFDLNFM